MNQSLTNFLAIWGSIISSVLLIIKIIERKKQLRLFIEFKNIYYETENGDQIAKFIKVKVLNQTNHNISIQNIEFIISRYFFIIPVKFRLINFLLDDEISITLFKPGESKIYEYDMSYLQSDGSRNIDLLNDNKIKDYCLRARIVYPDNSRTHSKKGISIYTILTN
jgi:hypothetical protein